MADLTPNPDDGSKEPSPLLMRAYRATEILCKIVRTGVLLVWLFMMGFSIRIIGSQGLGCSICLFTVCAMCIWAFYHAEIRYIFRRLIVWRRAPKLKGATLPPHMRAILHQKVKICRRLSEKLRPKLEERISLFLEMVKFKEKGVYFDITDYFVYRTKLRFVGPGYWSEKYKQYKHLGFVDALGKQIYFSLGMISPEDRIAGGISDEVRMCVAAEACLLILNRSYSDYSWLRNVEIWKDLGSSAGLASRGEVLLKWDAVQRGLIDGADGDSVTLHEFAHVLDRADDDKAQSIPVSKNSPEYKRWEEMLDRGYEQVRQAYEFGEGHVIDQYALTKSEHVIGATNSGKTVSYLVRSEFFPCATEAFFERSTELRDECPKIYGVMKDFYQLDPAEWPPPKLP